MLRIARDGMGLRVDVEDESRDLPVVIEPIGHWPGHGAGVRLVATMADEWGVAPRSDGIPGKSVWFELD